ncbi:HMA domain-containing protein [Fusarium keratoplasticum]|uniref:HMA domain-containing protein n=1 Tax=Fusarium keratoplasticum TaxID=1328300 RepID=A0ACC0QPJ3_9HYPO|nr:HMA domain-containing protein [Fusarium keratoplasticum]KAI8663273.1 HMA domain-containing protein [Fusarium keratoplasticum]
MACCYIAAFCISQLVNACQFLDLDNSIRYNEDKSELQYPERPRTADDQKVESNSIVLSLSGMTCSACSSSVEASLNSLPGVDRARVSLALQQVTVIGNSPNLDREAIKNTVLDLGYGVEIGPRSPKEIIDVLLSKEEIARLKSSFSQLAQCATVIQLVSLLLSKFGRERLSSFILFFIHLFCASLVLFAQHQYVSWIHIDGWKWVRGGQPNMNTLISSSVSLGTAFSFLDLLVRGPVKATPYYSSVIGLALVVVSGRYLETMSRRSAAEHLIRVYQPLLEDQYVKMYSTGQLVPQSFLRPGDEIVIESFSTIPCDCYITLGSASINQAIVTGESMPVRKSVGDFLLGGTRNMGQQLVCVVHKEQGSSFYAQLVQSAVEASGSKSEDFQFLDLTMNYFVIIVMSLAILVPLKDIYWSAHSLNYTFLRAAILRCMTILTCACPCALGLAIPSAVVAAANVASQKGIVLTKGFSTIQKLCSTQTVVFDKTGTLTKATLDVSRFQTSKTWAHHTADFWTYICAIEEHTMSTHPLGRAIFSAGVAHLEDPWVEAKMDLCTEGVMVEPGMGISGDVSIASQPWQHVTIGSLRYLQSCGILDLPEPPQESGCGVISVHIGIDYTYAGTLLVTDAVREDAKATMRQLDLMGCETKMLTGDVSHSAQRVSLELEISVLASEAKPQDKLNMIKRLQDDGSIVTMVGDGLNDAPSLSAADVGIALYHEAATPTVGASVVILNSRLDSIPLLLKIAKHTVQQIRYNLAWVLGYNCVALSMAAGFISPFGVVLTPPLAAAFMSASSILITLNGLWLRSRLAALDT